MPLRLFPCLSVSTKPFSIVNVKIQHMCNSVTVVTVHSLDDCALAKC